MVAAAVVMGGCSLDPGTSDDTTSEDTATGASLAACLPEPSDTPELGAVDVLFRNASDDGVYVLAMHPIESPSEVTPFLLYGPDGELIRRSPSRCEPECGDDEVICPTQCKGFEQVGIAVAPGETVSGRWSGWAQTTVDFNDACADVPACGFSYCVQAHPAERGTYQVAFAVTRRCATDSGEACDCASCIGLYTVEPEEELTAEFVYDGPSMVMVEYAG